MLRTLTVMGTGGLVLEMLGKIWACMRRRGKYNVLLKIFSGYIRKDYLKLWLERSEELTRYVKIAKYFMVGLCNRERFEGEEID
jgi:putative heme iron utilization protein